MKLLIDTDAFCKLAIGTLLDASLALFEAAPSECGRLAALPHQLRRGRVRNYYGAAACDLILPLAESFPVVAPPNSEWLDKLVHIPEIDPGEAQLLARTAEDQLFLITGDKRAIKAARHVDELTTELIGRVVALDALLLAHAEDLGPEEVRRRVQTLIRVDTTAAICFSESNTDPAEALRSYVRDLAESVAPLQLWLPPKLEIE